MREISPADAQRIDDRIQVHNATEAKFVNCYIANYVEEASQPVRIVRWNEAPNYPHFGEEDGQPRRQRVPEGGAIAIGLLIVAAASALYLIFG